MLEGLSSPTAAYWRRCRHLELSVGLEIDLQPAVPVDARNHSDVRFSIELPNTQPQGSVCLFRARNLGRVL